MGKILEIDRYLGSLLGLACGDALGAPLELTISGMFNPVSDMIDDRRSNVVKAGMWTDDTSMALCLAESIIEKGGFDPKNQMEKYYSWYRHGYLSSCGKCFGIGNSTERSLQKFARTGDPIAGDESANKAGNGSIMRLCPIPLAFAKDPKTAIRYSEIGSKTTHGAKECIDSCKFMSNIIIGCLRGIDKDTLLSPKFDVVGDLWNDIKSEKVIAISNGSYKNKNHYNIKSSGYVIDTLESAMWAFHNSDNFEKGALMAVNLGGDADTVGAVFGQIAGAFYGFDGIPKKWVNKIVMSDKIIGMASKIYELSRTIK
jgi:ADP-ribosylglycohydrolase